MSGLNKPLRLQSWIPPSFAWTTATDVFCIEVTISDPDVVEFISTGVQEVTIQKTNLRSAVCESKYPLDLMRFAKETLPKATSLTPEERVSINEFF
jgi:hypothetical protein